VKPDGGNLVISMWLATPRALVFRPLEDSGNDIDAKNRWQQTPKMALITVSEKAEKKGCERRLK